MRASSNALLIPAEDFPTKSLINILIIMIIMVTFINRTEEMEILEEIARSDRAELVLIYGRRRVGKSTLLIEFAKRHRALYLLADVSKNILEILANQIKDRFVRFGNWEDFFEFLYESDYEIIIIDEFQYLYMVNKAFPTQLQRWWEKIKERNKKIILCGSMISTIYKIAKGYGSALYGRKTREIKIEPLKFYDVIHFFPKLSLEKIVKIYSVVGGIPRYVEEFDPKLSLEKNIKKKILNKTSFLYNEPMNLLFEEFRDPASYISIILSIVQGYRRFNEISSFSGIGENKLSKYLMVLERVDIIEKDMPVTEKKIKVKRTRYRVKDNFYNFWFRYVFPNRVLLERNEVDKVYNLIMKDFNSYVGKTFEDIVIQIFPRLKIMDYDRVGRWWHKDKEIDIVAINDKERKILLGEVKWKSRVDCDSIVKKLKEKAEYVPWNIGERKEYYAVFAKSFERKSEEAICLDLQDIQRKINSR